MPTLSSIPLNDIDQSERMAFSNTFTQLARNEITSAVNKGGSADGFMTVTTRGRDDFLTYNVFVAKIRRESAGMQVAKQGTRVAWCSMVTSFMDKFGEDQTPPDIVTCLREVRALYGI